MKKNFRRLLGIALALAVVFTQAGCGKSSTSSGTSDSSAQTSGSSQISFVFAEHVANIQEQAPQVYAVVQAYMAKHPEVKINLQGSPDGEHTRNMKMAAQNNSLPELFWMEQGGAVEMAKAGYLADITSDITSDPELVKSFLPTILDSMKIDGKIYGIPCELQSNGIWLNKALFDKYGLKLPVTFDDMINCAKIFNANGIVPLAQGAKDTFTAWAMENIHVRYGFFNRIDNINNGTDKWNNPDYLKFYQKIDEMRKLKFFPDNVTNMSYAQSVELFLGGKAAMLNSGVWDTKKFDQSSIAKDVYYWWGPTFSDGVGKQEISMKAPAHPYVVSAKLKKEDPKKYAAVIDFLKFYYGKEGTQIIARDNQSIPVTKYTGEIDSAKYPVFARVMEKMSDNWESPKACPDMYISGKIMNQYRESICGVVNGIYTPEDAVNFMDEQQKTLK